MEDVKKLIEEICRDPEKRKGKSIILGIADYNQADILFMAGDAKALTKMMEVFLSDLNKQLANEYLN